MLLMHLITCPARAECKEQAFYSLGIYLLSSAFFLLLLLVQSRRWVFIIMRKMTMHTINDNKYWLELKKKTIIRTERSKA